MSLYFTKADERKKDSPIASKYISTRIKGNNIIEGEMPTWLNIMKIAITIRLSRRLITAERLLLKTIIHRGIRILRIKSPQPTIDPKLCIVISTKKFHNTIPNNKYTG